MKFVKFVGIACLIALPTFAQTTKTTTETKSKKTVKVSSKHTKVANDATRLAAILNDVQTDRTTLSADSWRVSVNEANALANRIYANTGGKAQARDLRMHVRKMREAALKGDAAGARQHASEALPFAYQLIDWATP
jgi:hypothetical protein